jgi:hypothetical protein
VWGSRPPPISTRPATATIPRICDHRLHHRKHMWYTCI